MKKTLLASLSLTLMLSTTAGVALAEEANPVPVAKDLTLASSINSHEQEPNNSFEQANGYFIGDAVIGTLGQEVGGMWEAYDVYTFHAFESNNVHFTIEGDRYSDKWLQISIYDSNGKYIKRSKDGRYFLDINVEKGKEYYLVVQPDGPGGFQPGDNYFDYRVSSEIVN
ncbi:hypothetical protein [Paenibacillus sp. BJ-4]|uniref:hypothetical protein n=1 Tax=Paenibacillus sp. BJ-4 TaxID=2878097 RepID=UPI001CF0AB0E|nr:hypothetical protein [Paenibacillus sp. BJ-4]